MGTRGLWIGPTAACAFLTITYNILIACIDWPDLIKEIRERRDKEKEEQNRILQEAKTAKLENDFFDDFEKV
jgi:phosphopantothenate synthetase